MGRRALPRGAGAAVAGIVGLVVLTGCREPSSVPAGAPGIPTARASAHGRLALLGMQPGETSSGVLVVDLATGRRVRVGGQQEAWSAAWAAGPERIAVVRHATGDAPGQLVLAAADGSDDGTPVGATADVQEVGGSTDGRHLAWLGRTAPASHDCAAPRTGEPLGLYVADGSGARRVADVPASTRTPVLSPDGRTVAVLDLGADTDPCDGGISRLVLIDTATGAPRVVTGLTQRAGTPRWSPDGRTIVLDGDDFDATQTRDLVLVDVASATAQRLVTPGAVETMPVFSPDGRHLALLRRTGGLDTASITVGLSDGTDQYVLALTGTDDQDLAWSPDGWLLAVAGAVVTPMCGDANAAGPAAPAGDCDVAGATPGVRVVRVSGGRLRQVSDTTSLLQAGLAFAP